MKHRDVRHTSLLSIMILGLTSAGCSSLHAELPSSRFESPETNGATKRFGARADITQTHDDKFTDDASARPPNLSRPSVEDDTVLGFAGSFGVLENFDLGLRTTMGPSPYVLVAKLQLAGPSASVAKSGDTSIALTGSVGWGGSGRSGDQSGTFGPGGNNWSGSVKNNVTDVALIIGTRVADQALLYGGGFYSNYRISAVIDQSRSDDGLSPAANYTIDTTGYQRGVNLGAQVYLGASSVYSQIEGVYSDVHVSGRDHSQLKIGLSLGAQF